MATLTNTAAHWSEVSSTNNNNNSNLITKLTAWADGQAPNRTLWFMVSLIAQGILFLPIPAVLLYYFDAPLAVLAVTLGLFFSNIIAGMGGAGIRAMLGLFAFSIIAHLLMILVFTV
jgi:DMSO/TMAO reductase YedYZ heme-binding membrane subunit